MPPTSALCKLVSDDGPPRVFRDNDPDNQVPSVYLSQATNHEQQLGVGRTGTESTAFHPMTLEVESDDSTPALDQMMNHILNACRS